MIIIDFPDVQADLSHRPAGPSGQVITDLSRHPLSGRMPIVRETPFAVLCAIISRPRWRLI